MWFLYLLAALALTAVGGLYARRRIAGALGLLGVGPRAIRGVRWLIAWLLFGFPILAIGSVMLSRLLGWSTMPRFEGRLASWLLVVPFGLALLVMLQSLVWLVFVDLAYGIVRRVRPQAAAGRMRAIAVIGIVAGFAIYTPVRILAQWGELRVRHHQVTRAGSTPTGSPFRIALVADVQQDVHTDAARARHVYGLVNASSPDLVLAGGDWINMGPDHIASAAEVAADLKSRLGTFSVIGDHEHFAYVDRQRSVAEIEQAMRAHGIAMLDNEVRWFEHAGKRIAVVFLDYNYIHRSDAVTIVSLVASVAAADYSIVVTHQLDAKLAALLQDKVDLVLAGHTHGGQVNPVIGVTHANLARLETPYVDGRYQLGATTIIVTAGIGYSIVPFRYASPGSIELIEVML